MTHHHSMLHMTEKLTRDNTLTPTLPEPQLTTPQLSELTHQLEQLSSKLVRSVERIASLEDELHEARRKNEKLASRNAKLELETAQHREAVEGGLLVQRENVQLELQRLTQRVTLESERRSKSEASLSSINQELDDLSASLFTEANRLVATETLARIQAERKVKEVQEAMKQVEEVIEARRDQSNDLRLSLEAAERDRDHYKAECEYLRNQLNNNHSDLNHPPIDGPTFNSRDSLATPLLNPSNQDYNYTSSCSPTPGYRSSPCGLQPIPQLKLSHEILPFAEFLQFLQHLRRTRDNTLTRPSQPASLTEPYYSTTTVVMTSIGINSHPTNQLVQASTKETVSPPYSKDLIAPVLPLSYHLSQPFVKRCLDEDSDPALRLDLAPGLNFISRRPIVTALLEGNLVIEPVWSESDRSTDFDKCTLCGCSLTPWLSTRGQSAASNQSDNDMPTNSSSARSTMRKMLRGGSWGFGSIVKPKRSSNPTPSTQQVEKIVPPVTLMRTNSGPGALNNDQGEPVNVHTFRTTDAASTRYPICPTYCLARLRSVCHFWTFVRSLERGVLLDESFWFSHYINPTPASSRFTEVQSLGLAYDSALKSIRQQAQSTDSLHDSPSLTHSDPSSANTFQSQTNQADLTCTLSASQTDDGTKQRSPSATAEDHQTGVRPEADHPSSRRYENIDVTCDPQPSPLPSPTSTSGHDIDTGHDVTPNHTVTILSPVSSPRTRKRSLVRSLSPSLTNFLRLMPQISKSEESDPFQTPVTPQKPSSFEADVEAEVSGDTCIKAKDDPLPDLHIPVQNPSLSTRPLSSQMARHGPHLSRDKVPSSIDLLEVGWEKKCWQQVVKLKEEMFHRRVGINLVTS